MSAPATGVELLALLTFQRRGDRLTIRRERIQEDEYRLAVVDNGRHRTFAFSDFERLVRFQTDMEAFLVRTGWSLVAFTPDRRSGRDRRSFPRIEVDRRRWWTDVPPTR